MARRGHGATFGWKQPRNIQSRVKAVQPAWRHGYATISCSLVLQTRQAGQPPGRGQGGCTAGAMAPGPRSLRGRGPPLSLISIALKYTPAVLEVANPSQSAAFEEGPLGFRFDPVIFWKVRHALAGRCSGPDPPPCPLVPLTQSQASPFGR